MLSILIRMTLYLPLVPLLPLPPLPPLPLFPPLTCARI